MTMKCSECGGKVSVKKVDFFMYGTILGKFPAEVCEQCGEQLFSEETSDVIDRAAKEKGLWRLESQTTVGQAGDSLIIRVNKKLADFYGLRKGKEVHIAPESKNKMAVILN